MRKILFAILLAIVFLFLKPAPVFCLYCQGGTPCYSNVDCSQGCRCQAPPYGQGVCIPQY